MPCDTTRFGYMITNMIMLTGFSFSTIPWNCTMLGWCICVRIATSCINLIVSAFCTPVFNCLTATSCLPLPRSSIPLYTIVFMDLLTWVSTLSKKC